MPNEYDELLDGMAQGSRRRGVKVGRPKERSIARRMTIELTKEKDDFVKEYMLNNHKRYAYEVVYEALELLAEKHNHNN